MNLNSNPYFTVWFRPSETFHRILSGNKRFYIEIPIIIASTSGAIASTNGLIFEFWGSSPPFIIWLTILAAMSLLGFLILNHLIPWLILLSGKLIGGKSNFRKMQLVVGLSQIPTILILALQLLHLILGELKSPDQVNYAVQFVAWTFSIRIVIIGLSIVQKYNYGLAIINLVIFLLPWIIIKLKIG